MEEGHVDRSHDTLTLDISLSKTELTVEISRSYIAQPKKCLLISSQSHYRVLCLESSGMSSWDENMFIP